MSVAVCDGMWMSVDVSGCMNLMWLHIVTCSCLWLYVAVCMRLWLYKTVCGYVRLTMALCGYMFGYMYVV